MVKKAINITKPRKKFNGQILRPKLLKSGNQNVATRKCSGGRDQPWINARSECQPLIFTPTNVSPPFNLFLFSSSSITHFPYALQNLGISLFLLLSDFVGFFFLGHFTEGSSLGGGQHGMLSHILLSFLHFVLMDETNEKQSPKNIEETMQRPKRRSNGSEIMYIIESYTIPIVAC